VQGLCQVVGVEMSGSLEVGDCARDPNYTGDRTNTESEPAGAETERLLGARIGKWTHGAERRALEMRIERRLPRHLPRTRAFHAQANGRAGFGRIGPAHLAPRDGLHLDRQVESVA
jgi:hypothetical protein